MEPFPWFGFAISDRSSDLGGDLFIEVGLGLIDLDTDHGASNTSTKSEVGVR